MDSDNQRPVTYAIDTAHSPAVLKLLNELVATAANHHNNGRSALAEQCYRQIVAAVPDWADARNNLGCALQAQNKLAEAAESYQRAVALDPNNAVAHHNLGFILQTRGNIDAAAEHYQKALVINPRYAQAHCNLGNILLDKGNLDQAELHYQHALKIDPDYPDAHNNLGNVFKTRGKLDHAAACYQKAISLNPDYADAYNNLGSVLMDQGRMDESVACYHRAIMIKPDSVEAHCNLGVVLRNQGKLDEAMGCFAKTVALDPDYPEAHNNCGSVLKDQGRLKEAATFVDRALVLRPNFAAAHCNRGSILQDQGRLEEAALSYRQALECKPGYAEAIYNLAHLKTFHPGDKDLIDLESLAADTAPLPPGKRAYVHFALAKALEDIVDYPNSFEQLLLGNRLKRWQIPYDEAGARDYLQEIAGVFDATLLNRCSGAGDPSATPIFVLGMPRSGSTLIEQILSSHPQIHGAGELTLLSDTANNLANGEGQTLQYPASFSALDAPLLRQLADTYLRGLPELPPGKLRVTDKMPGNFLYLGLIHLMLPKARIIHTVRSPADTCFSCFSKLFASGMAYSYDLAELGRYYRYYEQLMDHWRSVLPHGSFLDVRYEDLLDDFEGQARRLIEYCGLQWDPRCLSYDKNDRPVSTASNVHVRRPLFRSSVNRWQRYQAHLQPLLVELNRGRQ